MEGENLFGRQTLHILFLLSLCPEIRDHGLCFVPDIETLGIGDQCLGYSRLKKMQKLSVWLCASTVYQLTKVKRAEVFWGI